MLQAQSDTADSHRRKGNVVRLRERGGAYKFGDATAVGDLERLHPEFIVPLGLLTASRLLYLLTLAPNILGPQFLLGS